MHSLRFRLSSIYGNLRHWWWRKALAAPHIIAWRLLWALVIVPTQAILFVLVLIGYGWHHAKNVWEL